VSDTGWICVTVVVVVLVVVGAYIQIRESQAERECEREDEQGEPMYDGPLEGEGNFGWALMGFIFIIAMMKGCICC
jgi:hypothetical protein